MTDQCAGHENAGHENDGPNLQGIKLQNLTTLNTLACFKINRNLRFF